jgi:hypothetical protein
MVFADSNSEELQAPATLSDVTGHDERNSWQQVSTENQTKPRSQIQQYTVTG